MNPDIINFDYYFSAVTTAAQGLWMSFLTRILLTGKTMKPFLERLVGGRRSFRDLGMGETAALSHSASSSWPRGLSKGMRSPASLKRDVNKPLKKPAREPWNERKGFMVFA
jgi:hypothetical protein